MFEGLKEKQQDKRISFWGSPKKCRLPPSNRARSQQVQVPEGESFSLENGRGAFGTFGVVFVPVRGPFS